MMTGSEEQPAVERTGTHADAMRSRTRELALRVIALTRALPRNDEGRVIGRELLRSATSAAANYRAACHASTRASIIAKLDIVVEELDESEFWLDLIGASGLLPPERLEDLGREVNELVRIIVTARQTAQRNRQ